MFVILPFEVDFYRRFDVKVDYVGNPVSEAVRNHIADPEFTGSIRGSGFKKVAALLPGSRYQEVYQAIPLMMAIAESHKEILFLVAAVNNLPQSLYASCLNKSNIRVVPEKAYDILAVSQAAIVTSGTATLETALWKVPQVVIYKANLWISALVARMVIKVRYISLVNLICDREVVKELIQENLTNANLQKEFNRILNDDKRREEILNGYGEVEKKLGNDIASEKAAKLMLSYLGK
jgi:lipid-A-disaccharide synthase